MVDLVTVAMVILVIIFALSVLFVAFGENYVYKMSKNESDQVIISELCYAGVDVGECKFLYGSINSNEGEALK